MTVFSATSIFLVICLVGVALAASPPNDQECTPGSTFKRDCNTCSCSPDGKTAICTLKACLKKREAQSPPNNQECTPGTSFKRECNNCVCSPDGKAACTLKACLKKREAPPPKPGQEGYCIPGESFKLDCNSCSCTPDGKNVMCTQMACPRNNDLESKPVPGQEGYCTPGKSFMKDCNKCRCYSHGKDAYCTSMACEKPTKIQSSTTPRPQPGQEGYCTPGESFKQDCNRCSCTPDGKIVICTMKACPRDIQSSTTRNDPEPKPAPDQEGYCTPGESFMKECNKCRCSDDGKNALCTIMACPREIQSNTTRNDPRPQPGQEGYCTPGESFKQDCNRCSCTPDGKIVICTMKACPRDIQSSTTRNDPEPKPAPDQEGYCTPGESFMKECNKCRCSDDGKNALCTIMACPREIQSSTTRNAPRPKPGQEGYCTPGKSFKQDCNSCSCTLDGKNFICTAMACPRNIQSSTTRNDLEAKPGQEGYCTPGESFKQDCNSCSCTLDGKNFICTAMACPRNIQNSTTRNDLEAKPGPGQEGYCTPGESFKQDCNRCTCTPDGKNALCTLKACPRKIRSSTTSNDPGKIPGQEGYCTPGETFMNDCNSCTCTPDGKYAYCTLMACGPIREIQNRPTRNAPGKKPGQEGYCTPGKSFKKDCNTCICNANGKYASCTLMACGSVRQIQNRPTRNAPAPNTPGFTCTPGESFKYQCNTCRCGTSGTRAACTYAACPPGTYRRRRQAPAPNTPGFTCTPGETFKYQCNTCKCASNGTRAACTFAACPPGSYRRRRQAAECQVGETKSDECGNTCNCIQGEWACTRKACIKTKREDPVEKEFNGASCIPNDKFNIDCNTCYCNNDGSGYSCTEKSCVSASSIQT